MTDYTNGPARRAYTQARGESLLLPPDMVTLMTRFSSMCQDAGISGTKMSTSPLVSTPIPDLDFRTRHDCSKTSLLWHPLLWLPARLQRQPDEPVDLWSVRVALEMTFSAMYDPTTGEWFDVLAAYDLDILNRADRDRVKNWLSGAKDETLDSIDLDEFLAVPDDPDWSKSFAEELLEDLRMVATVRAARSLHEMVAGAMTSQHELFVKVPSRRAQVAHMAGAGAVAFLSGVDSHYDVDFEDLRDRIFDTDVEDIAAEDSAAVLLRDTLNKIIEEFGPHEDRLVAEFTERFGETPDMETLLGDGLDGDTE